MNKNTTIMKKLFIIFIAIKPVYLFGSGGLQLSDIILILLFFYLIYINKFTITWSQEHTTVFQLFTFTVLYQCVINFIFYALRNHSDFIVYSLYYIFNYIVFISIIMLRQYFSKQELLEMFCSGIFYSCLINDIGVLYNFGKQERTIGFFNNPNQLGYYCVIVLTVALICKKNLSKFKYAFIMISSIFGTIASLSKASIIASVIVIALDSLILEKNMSVKNIVGNVMKSVVLLLAVYIVMFSTNMAISNNPTIKQVRLRIVNMSTENDSNLGTGRGYDRISEIDSLIFVGAGEGDYSRFETLSGLEVHSTYANMLVSYGIIGAALYLAILINMLKTRNKNIRLLMHFSGILLYSISHNGIRNTVFWAFITTLLISKELIYEEFDKEEKNATNQSFN